MKHAQLRSIAHNIADSFACGMGFMIGVYATDVYGEAAGSAGGAIAVDFLEGAVVEGDASCGLREAVALYRDALPGLCAKHGGSIDDFMALKVRYWSTRTDRRFAVTVEDPAGRRSTTEYGGVAAQRLKVIDGQGRLRPKPHAR
ncbi:MAG TPA: hypothetical protein VFP12_03115 [Allosphingosinicella sp.]|nr:hypothetical protein [Allosphingosinicella sp.]